MNRFVIDDETTSTIDLPSAGADKYAEDATTRVLCVGWKFNNEPTQIWKPGDPVPRHKVDNADVFVAHNAGFEIALWEHKLAALGWPLVPPLERWSCTMARASYHGLPAPLEDVTVALRLPPHLQKDAAGRRLMLQMARPRSWSPITWWDQSDPAKYDALCRYCIRDVDVEAHLDRILPELPADEHELWRINQLSNAKGVHLDIDLMTRLGAIVRAETQRLNQELAQITNNALTTVNQVARIREWLFFEEGLALDVLDKETVSHVLETKSGLSKRSRRVLEIRAEAAKSSVAKLTAMWRSLSSDLQARGLFRYYGAGRTGRYSSQRVQLHNLARPTIKDVPVAIDLIKRCNAGAATLNLLFDDNALGVVSSCLRGCLMARPGYQLVIADLAQIEARVIAWLANEFSVLSVFGAGQDVYVWTAAQVGSTNRQLGKVMVLALGFGMGPSRFIKTAASYGITIDAHTAEGLVWSWRQANSRIVQFWWDLEEAALRVATATHGYAVDLGYVALRKQRQAMVIRLPSERDLFYQRVGTVWAETTNGRRRRQVVYEGVNQYTRKWELLRAWPGKLAENVTQAVARDALTHTLRTLHRAGIGTVGSVHDEPIAEVPAPEAPAALNTMLAVMRRAPPWARRLPVHAEGRIAERFGK